MRKIKIIFNQTIMISSAVLFGIGIQTLVNHLIFDYYMMQWEWYVPLSIILTGFIASLPTLLLLDIDEKSRMEVHIRMILHFIFVGCIVCLSGYFFKWFTTIRDFLPVLIMYVLIYVFVWAATGWLAKSDEKKINDAIKDYQDKE